ncbi:hypothetical protein D0T87_04995 [Bacteroides sp. 51]|nr:hypothetical protein [Bacteroides sp. 51]
MNRYSHTAIVTAEPNGRWEHGEWIEREPNEITIKGQYFPSNSGNQLKYKADGKEFTVKGEFSTKHKKIDHATHIRIGSIGLDAKIESWEQFQTHSVIYI